MKGKTIKTNKRTLGTWLSRSHPCKGQRFDREPGSQDVHRGCVSGRTVPSWRKQLHLQPVCIAVLFMSRSGSPPLSLSWTVGKTKPPGQEDRAAALVGTVTDGVRVLEAPTVRVCAACSPRGWPRPALSSLQGPGGA